MTPSPADRLALSIGGSSVVLVVLALVVSQVLGLQHVQAVVWPTDLYTFAQLPPQPIDVALVGSSRTTFGLAPTALDPCLSEAVGRPIRSVNLARVYANMLTEVILVDQLLDGERRPEVLVVEVAPEIVNAHHHEQTYNMATALDVAHVPQCLQTLQSPADLVACARAPLRGVENLAWFLAGGPREVNHLEWMMVHHRGGQFCFGSAACEAHNARFESRLAGRWDARVARILPTVTEERYGTYDLDRSIHMDALEGLVDDTARDGTRLVLLNMPVHASYQAEVPPDADALFRSRMSDLARKHAHVQFVDANTEAWQQRRGLFQDPDHLLAEGARELSLELCDALKDDIRR